MEVSSPSHSNLYDDIELDFDDGIYDGGVQLQEDEPMLTDGEQTRPETATDDMMDDDAQGVETAAPETDMQDTPDVEQQVPAQQEDEELIDYGDDEYYNQQQIEDTAVQDVAEIDYAGEQSAEAALEDVDEETVHDPQEAGLQQSGVLFTAEQPADLASADVAQAQTSVQDAPAYAAQAIFAGDENTFEVMEDNDQTLVAEPGADDAYPELMLGDLSAREFAGDAETLQPSLTIDTISADNVEAPADVPGTPTDTGLHPMTVYYGTHMMPLFKSKRQPEGLLKDDNLASLSLAELMRNCRQRLALKIGNVPEEQELTLAFDHMGLMLLENSRAAFEHSLNDVLEVYMQLHQNDGTEDTPPLSITLSHEQFSNHLALLQQAAANGKGIYDFVPRDEEGEQEYYQEEDEENGGEADGFHVPQEEQEQYYDGGEDDVGEEYTQDQRHAEQEYHEEAADQPRAGAEDDHHAQQRSGPGAEATSGQDASFDAPVTTAEEVEVPAADDAASADVEVDTDNAHEDEEEDQEAAVSARETGDEVRKAESTASSHTAQGDHADGEYEEDDLIDWDEDSTLTSTTSELPAGARDDLSTFLTEYDAKQSQQSSAEHPDPAHREDTNSDVQQAPEDPAHGETGGQYAGFDSHQQIIGSEEFLNDFDEQNHDGDTKGVQHKNGLEDEEQITDQNPLDQADTFGEQHDDFQPGEEEEQYHAALDIINGDSREHGRDHQTKAQVAGHEEPVLPDEQVTNQKDQLYDDFLNGQEPDTYAPQDGQGYTVPDPEDDIDFDDDTTEQHEARKASQHEITAVSSGSPLGKRSFERDADLDEIDFDEPELKKVRSQ
ncbi:hypothetical protein LTR36_006221 [Oleoguttula mirabilis]|uniref:Uncharacterized protein n=1 Tax=Oleoguttula mirabilis TaxID=1507867 RepID=A0AAV9JBR2_9PEZI|nr:hypothetical protein LTR36_006221 [Oleoguttula mirabilis]